MARRVIGSPQRGVRGRRICLLLDSERQKLQFDRAQSPLRFEESGQIGRPRLKPGPSGLDGQSRRRQLALLEDLE